MKFNVTFAIGDDTEILDLDYTDDLAGSQQFKDFVNAHPYLLPVRGLQRDTKRMIVDMRKLAITTITINTLVHLNLRYFDGATNGWFDSLNLPNKHKTYVVVVNPLLFSPNQRVVEFNCPVLKQNVKLTAYDVFALVTPVRAFDEHTMVLLTAASRQHFPRLFKSL